MDLYKEEGINPLSGCLPQIAQIAVLIIFFSAFNLVSDYSIGKGTVQGINSHLISSFQINQDFKFDVGFLGSRMSDTPSGIFKSGFSALWILPFILLVGSGALQYLSAKMMMPSPKVDEKMVEKTKDKEDDMMGMMRTQSLYMMPAMTIFIGWGFSLGMLLYWFVNSAVMLGQQLVVAKLDKK